MAFQLCSCWTSLCIVVFLLRNISADPSSQPRYSLNYANVSFNEAIKRCSPNVLTTIATHQELDEILTLISESVPFQKFTFWVGLKLENQCVDLSKPLRGFRWLENGSQDSEVNRWLKEPKQTCTALRCAALRRQFDGSNVTWGLIPLLCDKSTKNSFICKLKDRLTGWSPEGRQKTTQPGPEPASPEPTPAEPSKPATPETTPTPTEPELKLSTSRPVLRSEPGVGNGSALVSVLCQRPSIPGTRSLILDSNDSSRIQVECWSHIRFDLVCSGQPTMWRLVNGSQANFSAISTACANGNDGEPISQSTILIPVLIAVGVLVVLLVVIAVTVKCCLKRRSKKRAIKKAEKMEMKSKDRKGSFSLA